MDFRNKLLIILSSTSFVSISQIGYAATDIISKDQFQSKLIAPLSLQFSGQLRPQWGDQEGSQPGYYRNGHDAGSRVRLHSEYELNPETKLLGHWEEGISVPKILGMDNHYSPTEKSHFTREAYLGVENDQFGKLTYGRQFGLYYSVVGIKSDYWDNTGNATATGNGVDGTYDGSNRPTKSLMYVNSFGDLKLYSNYLFSEDPVAVAGGFNYKRNSGAGIGFDYKLPKDTTLSLAYSRTDATIQNPVDQDSKNSKQEVFGSALNYSANNLYSVVTASYYKDFVPSKEQFNMDNFFTGHGYGLEFFTGYKFNLDKPLLQYIQPYFAADTLSLSGHQDSKDYREHHQYIGFETGFNDKLKVLTEYTFGHSSDNSEKDIMWVTFFYSF